MERWNFDFIFSGTLDERGCKAKTFMEGADRLTQRAEEQFAMAHLTNEAPEKRWADLKDLQEMQVAFCKDPRTRAILVEKTTQQFGEVGAKTINSFFERMMRSE